MLPETDRSNLAYDLSMYDNGGAANRSASRKRTQGKADQNE
ncbi:MAG: hypothetical protein ACLSG5_13155 [Oscillospiraceae bacterium]